MGVRGLGFGVQGLGSPQTLNPRPDGASLGGRDGCEEIKGILASAWLVGNEGMEKNMEATILLGIIYMGTTILLFP